MCWDRQGRYLLKYCIQSYVFLKKKYCIHLNRCTEDLSSRKKKQDDPSVGSRVGYPEGGGYLGRSEKGREEKGGRKKNQGGKEGERGVKGKCGGGSR